MKKIASLHCLIMARRIRISRRVNACEVFFPDNGQPLLPASIVTYYAEKNGINAERLKKTLHLMDVIYPALKRWHATTMYAAVLFFALGLMMIGAFPLLGLCIAATTVIGYSALLLVWRMIFTDAKKKMVLEFEEDLLSFIRATRFKVSRCVDPTELQNAVEQSLQRIYRAKCRGQTTDAESESSPLIFAPEFAKHHSISSSFGIISTNKSAAKAKAYESMLLKGTSALQAAESAEEHALTA
jgi:hypothetical protein